MKKLMLIFTVLFIAVVSTACINNFAVQELNNKAKVLMEQGDYEGAINRLEASIDLDSTIFETQYNLGVAYIKAKKFEKAINTLNKAISIKSDVADTYYSLAVAQDSYAQEILEFKDSPKQNNEESNDIVLEDNNPIKNMSADERKQMALDLYNKAIDSYNKYIELSPKSNDIEDINKQIEEINNEINNLGKK